MSERDQEIEFIKRCVFCDVPVESSPKNEYWFVFGENNYAIHYKCAKVIGEISVVLENASELFNDSDQSDEPECGVTPNMLWFALGVVGLVIGVILAIVLML